MFSQASVKNSVHRGWGHVWQGGMHGRGHVSWGDVHAWQGVCMAGGVHGRGCALQGACVMGVCMVGGMCGRGVHGKGGVHGRGHGGRHTWHGACVGAGCAWQERRPLQRAVRILLECILVISRCLNRNPTEHGFNLSCIDQIIPEKSISLMYNLRIPFNLSVWTSNPKSNMNINLPSLDLKIDNVWENFAKFPIFF